MKTIKVCAGIGDNLWLFQKLINADDLKFNFILAGDTPRRGKNIFDLWPKTALAMYGGHTSIDSIELNIQKICPNYKDIEKDEFFLSPNEHLEAGRRIEDFFPDIETSYILDFNTNGIDIEVPENSMIIYTSSYSTNRHWNFWGVKEWTEFAEYNKKYKMFLVGADFDIDLAGDIYNSIKEVGVDIDSCIGKPIDFCIDLMKKVHCTVAFPSGIGILSELVGCKTMMFYPKHLKLMKNAWAEDSRIVNGSYIGVDFISPEEATNLIRKNW